MSSSCETAPLIIFIMNSLRTWLQSVVKEARIKASITLKLQMRISSKSKGLRLQYRLSSDLMATSEKTTLIRRQGPCPMGFALPYLLVNTLTRGCEVTMTLSQHRYIYVDFITGFQFCSGILLLQLWPLLIELGQFQRAKYKRRRGFNLYEWHIHIHF